MEFTVNIKFAQLDAFSAAVQALAAALGQKQNLAAVPAQSAQPTKPAQAPVATPAVPVQAQPGAAVQAPPVAAPTSVPSTPAAPAPVPLTAPTYTLEQISNAGAALASQGPAMVAALTGVMQQFGIQSIAALPEAQYGAFATALRGLGAQI